MNTIVLAQLVFSVTVWALAILYCLIRNWEIYWFGLFLYPLHIEATFIRFGILLVQIAAFAVMKISSMLVALDTDMVTAASRNINGLAARNEINRMQRENKRLQGDLKAARKMHNKTQASYSTDMKSAKAIIDLGLPQLQKFINKISA